MPAASKPPEFRRPVACPDPRQSWLPGMSMGEHLPGTPRLCRWLDRPVDFGEARPSEW